MSGDVTDSQLARIWVTRSQPGAQRLAAAIDAAGFQPWVAPVLDIKTITPPTPLSPLVKKPDYVAVMSEQAILHAPAELLGDWREAGVRFFAVGKTTAQTMAVHGLLAQHPDLESSEGLLAECFGPLSLKGRKVVVLAGLRGRSVMLPGLQARGAQAEDLAVYERRAVTLTEATFTNELQQTRIGAIVASSGDALAPIAQLWRAAAGELNVPIFTPSVRVAEMARGIGFRNAYNCEGAGASAVCRALRQQFKSASG